MARATLWVADHSRGYIHGRYDEDVNAYAPEPGVCVLKSNHYPNGTSRFHEDIARAVAKPSSLTIVPYSSAAALNLRQGYGVKPTYFGSYVNTTDPVEPTITLSSKEWRTKGKTSASLWRSQKRNGSIVFRRLNVGTLSIRSQPGLDTKYQTGSPGTVIHGRTFTSFLPYEDKGTSRCTINGRRTSFEPPYVLTTYSSLGELYMKQYSFTDTRWLHLHEVEKGLLEALEKFVEGVTHAENNDVGLSTSVICEANAGAWDILTEIGEAVRETIPSIIHACIAILNKYRELRKQIKKLKANSISEGQLKADLASLWLNFRYGIGPLAYSLADALAYMDSGIKKYQSYRDGMTEEKLFEYGSVSGTLTVTHRCLVRDFFSSDFLGRYNTSGLQINGFATLWELAPTSVFIDWVFNIGDTLVGLVDPDGLAGRNAMYSWRCNDTMLLTSPLLPGAVVEVTVNSYACTPHLKTPIGLSVSPHFSNKRIMDAIAVLWGGVKNPLHYR